MRFRRVSPKIFARSIAYGCTAVALTAAAATLASDTRVVSQGGVGITVGDVDGYMNRVPREKWSGFIESAERIEGLLRNVLRTKQLAQQALDLKLDQDPQVRAQLRYAQDEVLAHARLDRFTKELKIPDLNQLAKERYTAQKAQFAIPARVTVQHLLIGTGERPEAEARALAEHVRDEAMKDPDQFDALVEKYSEDPSKANNHGKMVDATSSKYVPEFARAADALTEKTPISPLVKTKFGFHVIKLLNRQPERQQTFDQVKDKLLADLREQYVSDQRRDFLNQLSNQVLDPNPDAVAALHDRYFQGNATGDGTSSAVETETR